MAIDYLYFYLYFANKVYLFDYNFCFNKMSRTNKNLTIRGKWTEEKMIKALEAVG